MFLQKVLSLILRLPETFMPFCTSGGSGYWWCCFLGLLDIMFRCPRLVDLINSKPFLNFCPYILCAASSPLCSWTCHFNLKFWLLYQRDPLQTTEPTWPPTQHLVEVLTSHSAPSHKDTQIHLTRTYIVHSHRFISHRHTNSSHTDTQIPLTYANIFLSHRHKDSSHTDTQIPLTQTHRFLSHRFILHRHTD